MLLFRHILKSLTCAIAAGIIPAHVLGQSVAIESFSPAMLCVGRSMTIEYTANGNFIPGNAFIAQLSGPDGSFTQGFSNIGAATATGSGMIEVTLPESMVTSDRYRLRVISSNPAVIGPDNGADLTLQNAEPDFNVLSHGLSNHVGFAIFVTDRPIEMQNVSAFTPNASYDWDFGEGAEPRTASGETPPPIEYNAAGAKTITLAITTSTGCLYTKSRTIRVFPMRLPIPHDAVIAQVEGVIPPPAGTDISKVPVWVCPGGSYDMPHPKFSESVAVESGGIVRIGSEYWGNVYLKSGATLEVLPNSKVYPNVLLEEGASIIGKLNSSARLVHVERIEFDYTDAPAGGCPSLASYSAPIKSGAFIVEKDQQSAGSNGEYLVSASAALTLEGDHNTILSEAGAIVRVNGNNNRIYLKDNATLESTGGSGNRIYFETQAIILNAGDNAVFFPADIIEYIPDNIVSVPYEQLPGRSTLHMFPNPARDNVVLSIDEAYAIQSITIHDILGMKVDSKNFGAMPGARTISIRHLAPGIYFISASVGTKTLTHKLIVR